MTHPTTEHPILREPDASAIDTALRGDKPKLRAEIERLERHYRGITKLDLPESQSGATLRQILGSIKRLRAHLLAAIVAGAVTFPAFMPAPAVQPDSSLPKAPHEAEPARTLPSVTDDARGFFFSRWI